MHKLIWAFLAFTAIAFALNPHRGLEPEGAAPRAEASQAPRLEAVARPAQSGDTTVLERDGSGQFHLAARINGTDTDFLIDTGADVVALSTDSAERLGVNFDRSQFVPVTRTASGIGYGQVVRLDQVEVAGQEFDGVQAIVLDGLGTNLLGQSLLKKMGRVELHGDRMVIDH